MLPETNIRGNKKFARNILKSDCALESFTLRVMEQSGPRLRVSRKRQQVLLSLLRALREERDLRQDEVARRLGFPQSFVSKYESGERRLDLLELYDLCSVVGISMTGFVRRFERELTRVIPKVSTRSVKRKSTQ